MILNIITASKGGLPPLTPSERFSALAKGLRKTSQGTTAFSFSSGSRPRSTAHNAPQCPRTPPVPASNASEQITRRSESKCVPDCEVFRGVQLIKELKPYLIGWRGYFGFCQTPRVLTNLEAWTRRRLRMYLWRQWGNGHNRFKELRRRGVPKLRAAVAAGSPTGFWRMSGHPAVQQALRNHHFESLGLPRLYVSV